MASVARTYLVVGICTQNDSRLACTTHSYRLRKRALLYRKGIMPLGGYSPATPLWGSPPRRRFARGLGTPAVPVDLPQRES